VVAWLWEVVHGLAPEEQRKFLKFVSGSDRAPIGGLANLRCTIQVACQTMESDVYVRLKEAPQFADWLHRQHPSAAWPTSAASMMCRLVVVPYFLRRYFSCLLPSWGTPLACDQRLAGSNHQPNQLTSLSIQWRRGES